VTLKPGGLTKFPTENELRTLQERLKKSMGDLKVVAEVVLSVAGKIPHFQRPTEYVSLKQDNPPTYTFYHGEITSTDYDGAVAINDWKTVANEYVSDQSTAKWTKWHRKSYAVGALARFNNNAELLSPTAKNLDLNADLIKRRLIFAREREGTIGKCTAEIHSRMAFSCSALVLLTLGAGLGIIFRGGHFVSAFGQSFIPMLVVILLIMSGKQYCGAGLTPGGTIVIWLGLGLVAVANVVILGKYLRR